MRKAPIRVAIVDDEPAVRTALARLLEASSFEPKTYGSAHEFIDCMGRDIPECLIVDVHMPDFTGLELAALSQSHQQENSDDCHNGLRRCCYP